MTLENIHDPYLFHFNNAEVDFFQLENLTLLNIPNKVTLVLFSLFFNNCIIRNNNILGKRILMEDHPIRNKNVIYLEEIGGDYYISYIQRETHRKYRFNKNPMNVTGSNGKCFNNSFIGDICENTNPTVITSGDTSYIITNWVCTSPSDETNIRGVWKEIKQLV